MHKPRKKIYWTALLFITINLLVGVVAMVLLPVFGLVHWPTWILLGVFWFLSGTGITAGYHRLFSHVTYKATWPVRLVLMLLGSSVFQGSVLEWCSDHRNHHLYNETDKDPYSITKGFWYAHIGWLFVLEPNKRDFSNVEDDLMKDPILRFQHRFYVPIAIFMGYVLPALIGALWGDALSGFLLAGAFRIALVQQSTFCINSICHAFGKRTYSDKLEARDNWVTALVTNGEGYHNFHHQFPKDYRNAIRFYQYDPSKWLIAGLCYLKLASGRSRVSQDKIVRYQVRFQWQTILEHSQQYVQASYADIQKFVKPVYENLLETLKRIDFLQGKIATLKKDSPKKKSHDYRVSIKSYKKELKTIKWQLKYSLKAWKPLVVRALSSKRVAIGQ